MLSILLFFTTHAFGSFDFPKVVENFRSEWNRLIFFVTGEKFSSQKNQENLLTLEQRTEIFFELKRNIAVDPQLFDWTPWLQALQAGASIEGIHNGILHSEAYRKLEKNPKWKVSNLFKEWMKKESNLLRKEISKPLWDEKEFNQIESFFILKKILVMEASHALLVASGPHGKLLDKQAYWYSKWVSRLAKERGQVDFGLEKRNSEDISFHEKWAKTAPSDLLFWELLNRYHRLANDKQLE